MNLKTFGSLAALMFAFAAPVHAADKTMGDSIDDTTINGKVKAELLGAKGVPSTKISVETYKGVVLLSGFVEKQAEKDTAGNVAKAVKGVQKLRNQLIVHPSTSMGTKLDDTVLTTKVKTALIDEKNINANQINVETKGGIVQLAGFVKAEKNRDLAVKVAKGVEGVKSVDDALFVKPD